jgi:hypothetical protein
MNTYVVNFDEGTMRVQAKNEAEALSILTEWFECSPTLLQLIYAFGDLKNRIHSGRVPSALFSRTRHKNRIGVKTRNGEYSVNGSLCLARLERSSDL